MFLKFLLKIWICFFHEFHFFEKFFQDSLIDYFSTVRPDNVNFNNFKNFL